MNTAIVIPARYASSRFPGKPLAKIAGHSMLYRVWRIAQAVNGVDKVLIATDDERIVKHAGGFGADVVMTSADCKNGTERAYAALKTSKLSPEVIINLQGDAVLTPPAIIQALVDKIQTSKEAIQICTPAVRLSPVQYEAFAAAKRFGASTGTLVTFDRNLNAMYFSKALIPFIRNQEQKQHAVYRHIGIYAYRREALEKYLSLEATPFEQAEQLEQLRALEHGLPIKVVVVDYGDRTHGSVDVPADVQKAEEIIDKEGELVDLQEH